MISALPYYLIALHSPLPRGAGDSAIGEKVFAFFKLLYGIYERIQVKNHISLTMHTMNI